MITGTVSLEGLGCGKSSPSPVPFPCPRLSAHWSELSAPGECSRRAATDRSPGILYQHQQRGRIHPRDHGSERKWGQGVWVKPGHVRHEGGCAESTVLTIKSPVGPACGAQASFFQEWVPPRLDILKKQWA